MKRVQVIPGLVLALGLAQGIVTAQAAPARNLGFDEFTELPDGGTGLAGWHLRPGGYELRVDEDVRWEGRQSLRFRWQEDAATAVATQGLSLDELRGKRVRFGGYIRTEALDGGLSALFLRVDTEAGMLRQELSDSPDPRGTRPFTRYEVSARIPQDATAVYGGVIVKGEGTLWADGLYLEAEALPEDEPLPPVVDDFLDRALDIMQGRSIRRDEVDWEALRRDTVTEAAGSRHPDELYGLIRGALDRLGDDHSLFMTPAEFQRWRDRRPSQAQAEASTPKGRVLDERYALIEVPGLLSGKDETKQEYAEILGRLIARAAGSGVCGWMLDLRDNTGGNMWPMLLGLSPLLGEGEVGAFVDADDGRQTWRLEEKRVYNDGELILETELDWPRLVDAPVAVLTGPRTASAAEAVAVAFRGRPGSRSFGARTAGLSTSNQGFRLPDGAAVFLTTVAVMDREGEIYGKQIPVDQAVEAAVEDPKTEDAPDPVVEAARTWLASQPDCR